MPSIIRSNGVQEEHPPIIPNFGMGSVLVNYYRKKDEKDEHVPKVSETLVELFYFRIYFLNH